MESYVMNYYRNIDRDKVQFDFITHTKLDCSFENEILQNGGRVYKFPVFSMKNMPNLLQQIEEFFLEHPGYQIIHCHMANAAPFYFYIAKKYGVKHCILHSHQPSAADTITHKLRNIPLLYLGNRMATDRIACSKLAGDFLFRDKPFKIIRNAIDIKNFTFNPEKREKVRKELGLANHFVIGHIGRLTAQKNQLFLLDVFNEISSRIPNALLILVGGGEDEDRLRKRVEELQLKAKVKFLGIRSDVNDLYQAFDFFLFPSLYEGLGIVLVEAQCAGLEVLTSRENIPQEVKLTNHLSFMSLKKGYQCWAQFVVEHAKYKRYQDVSGIIEKGYDITREAVKLEEYYLSLT